MHVDPDSPCTNALIGWGVFGQGIEAEREAYAALKTDRERAAFIRNWHVAQRGRSVDSRAHQ